MRTSLLLNCSRKEADEVRKNAELQSRTVSAYVIRIVMRSVSLGEKLDNSFRTLPLYWERQRAKKEKTFRPRTTLHVYCTVDEAHRIRRAAQTRAMTISGLVLSSLHRSWLAEKAVGKMYRND